MFFVGLALGGLAGVMLTALAVAGRQSDDAYFDAVADELAQRLRDEAGA